MSDDMDGIGRRIRERRLALGLTQRELGELVKAGPDVVSRHECGRLGLAGNKLVRYARALSVSVEWLTGERAGVASDAPVARPIARLLSDGRCNPVSDDEMARLDGHLGDGGSGELVDLEVRLLAYRAERDQTDDALAKFVDAVKRARKLKSTRPVDPAPAPEPEPAKPGAKKRRPTMN